MIARLPGQTKDFMGENLEIVCLFQAAEIERLIDSLQDFKLKYKEVEKKDLDRHSYEIQIKELSEKISAGATNEKDVNKLKDFIQKQGLELEEYKRKCSDIDVNIQGKYQKALKQVEIMHKDNSELKIESNNLKQEIQNWKARVQALDRSKNKELEEIKGLMENQKRSEVER